MRTHYMQGAKEEASQIQGCKKGFSKGQSLSHGATRQGAALGWALRRAAKPEGRAALSQLPRCRQRFTPQCGTCSAPAPCRWHRPPGPRWRRSAGKGGRKRGAAPGVTTGLTSAALAIAAPSGNCRPLNSTALPPLRGMPAHRDAHGVGGLGKGGEVGLGGGEVGGVARVHSVDAVLQGAGGGGGQSACSCRVLPHHRAGCLPILGSPKRCS